MGVIRWGSCLAALLLGCAHELIPDAKTALLPVARERGPTCPEKDLSSLYPADPSDEALQKEAIEVIYKDEVDPVLTPNEKSKIQGWKLVILREERCPSLFSFYSDPVTTTVSLSLLSLIFMHDILTADTWLMDNGYLPETVLDYVVMLKYMSAREFEGNQYPMPFEALQIPRSILNNQRTMRMVSKRWQAVLTFILAHELGHLAQGHEPSKQENEYEADKFALEILRRSRIDPSAIASYFTAVAYWVPQRGDFKSEEEYRRYVEGARHPLTGDRLIGMSSQLTEAAEAFGKAIVRNAEDATLAAVLLHHIADAMGRLGGLLKYTSLHATVVEQRLASGKKSLAPRPVTTLRR